MNHLQQPSVHPTSPDTLDNHHQSTLPKTLRDTVAAGVMALLTATSASGKALSLDEVVGSSIEGYVGGFAPGSFIDGATFDELIFFALDGTRYTTRGKLSPDSAFSDGTIDNLLFEVVDKDGNIAGHLSTGFFSDYIGYDADPDTRTYTTRYGSLLGVTQYDNLGVPSVYMASLESRFDFRPIGSQSIPEPATYAMLATGGLGLISMMRRRREQSSHSK